NSQHVRAPTRPIGLSGPGQYDPNSTVRIKKRDRLREIFRIPKSKSKDVRPMSPNQLTKQPSSIVSRISNNPPRDSHAVLPAPVTQEVTPQPPPQSLPLNKEQVAMNVFPENIPQPVIKIHLPRLQERIKSTEQLVFSQRTHSLLEGEQTNVH
ncbi:hypothetical protein EC991_008409, partial [Linnemannia zychae]